jgi:hypothetical protein
VDLDTIIARLAASQQRATYGAVGGVLGRVAKGLMAGRTNSRADSWVVAATDDARSGSRRGWPTGYTDAEIDPACLAQCRSGPAAMIDAAGHLREWLTSGTE